jgi:hypothetical protein
MIHFLNKINELKRSYFLFFIFFLITLFNLNFDLNYLHNTKKFNIEYN